MSADGAHSADGGFALLPLPAHAASGVAAQPEGGAPAVASGGASASQPPPSNLPRACTSAGAGVLPLNAPPPLHAGGYAVGATPPLAALPARDVQATALAAALPAAAGGGAQPAAAPAAPAPSGAYAAPRAEEYLGRYVRREFTTKRDGTRAFIGKVVSTRYTRSDGRLWGVQYDDGSSEELDQAELSESLLPEGEAGAAGNSSLRAGASAHPADAAAGAVAPRKFKGVSLTTNGVTFEMHLRHSSGRVFACGFADAEAAARAYDVAARKRGIKVLNFPNADAGEVQAVAGESNDATLKRLERGGGAAAAAPAPRAAATPHRPPPRQPTPHGAAAPAAAFGGALSMYDRLKLPRSAQRGDAPDDAGDGDDDESDEEDGEGEEESDGDEGDGGESEEEEEALAGKYKGVLRSKGRVSYEMSIQHGGERLRQYSFPDAKAAARAYDVAARKRGIKVLNFPDIDAGEVQAVPGENHDATLKRLGIGGSGGARRDARPVGALLRKRSRSRSPAGAQRDKQARANGGRFACGGRDAGGSRERRRIDKYASLEAFLRSISPPLSQARHSQADASWTRADACWLASRSGRCRARCCGRERHHAGAL
jgi:hypothetical protein